MGYMQGKNLEENLNMFKEAFDEYEKQQDAHYAVKVLSAELIDGLSIINQGSHWLETTKYLTEAAKILRHRRSRLGV